MTDYIVDDLIVGAGPAGLQMAHFLEHENRSYVVLEAGDGVGTFFKRYPVGGKLISINKIRTGVNDREFNLRHDWNSLLDLNVLESNDPNTKGVWMSDITDEYYPRREDMVKYLEQFTIFHNLRVITNQRVVALRPEIETFRWCVITNNDQKWYVRSRVWWATGLIPEFEPNQLVYGAQFLTPYGDVQDILSDPIRRSNWENHEVAVWGNGNAALEIANLLTPVCSRVHLIGIPKGRRWNWNTHYPGDLRGVYAPFFDTFALKSLNSVNCLPPEKPLALFLQKSNELDKPDTLSLHLMVDEGKADDTERWYKISNVIPALTRLVGVVNATGWKTAGEEVFNSLGVERISRKYWRITSDFEVIGQPGLFVIGAQGHVHDHRRSAGGFVHGFRYLTRWCFEHHVRKKYRRYDNLTLIEVATHLQERWLRASDIYQMYGVLSDILWCDQPNDPSKAKWTIVEGVHIPSFLSNRTPFAIEWNDLVTQPQLDFPNKVVELHKQWPSDHNLSTSWKNKSHIPIFITTLEHGHYEITDTVDMIWNAQPRGPRTPGNDSRSIFLHPVMRVFSWPWPDISSQDSIPGVDYISLTQHYNLLHEVHFPEELDVQFHNPNLHFESILRTLNHPWWPKMS